MQIITAETTQTATGMAGLNLGGKYLTFALGEASYAVDVRKVREIIRLTNITPESLRLVDGHKAYRTPTAKPGAIRPSHHVTVTSTARATKTPPHSNGAETPARAAKPAPALVQAGGRKNGGSLGPLARILASRPALDIWKLK